MFAALAVHSTLWSHYSVKARASHQPRLATCTEHQHNCMYLTAGRLQVDTSELGLFIAESDPRKCSLSYLVGKINKDSI